jgi:hypothetical protein
MEHMTWEDAFTEEEIQEMIAADKEIEQSRRKEGLKWAILQRCEYESDYTLNQLQRWFYTFKAIVCLLMNRKTDLWAEDCISTVAYWDYHGGYRDSWEQLAVGRGVFKNWHYDVYQNSSY